MMIYKYNRCYDINTTYNNNPLSLENIKVKRHLIIVELYRANLEIGDSVMLTKPHPKLNKKKYVSN